MKYWYVFSLLFNLNFISAQSVDSVAIKQVDSLIKISRELTAKGDFDKAFEVNAVAEKIALEKLGRESAAYGSCAFNRGRVNDYKGDKPEAEKWYLEAKAIRGKALGKEHPFYAKTLNNLALLYANMGNYEKAESLYLEAKAIYEKMGGKEHPDYAGTLSNLGVLYSDMANYEKAEGFYLEAKSIREKAVGKEHPEYAASLTTLANLYLGMGQYEKAEPLFLEAKAIYEKVLGREHQDYASFSLSNLALLYMKMGQYKKAEPLYLEASAILEKRLGKEHPFYANTLNKLALLYSNMGNYEKAEPLYLEAKAIYEKMGGREHPNYAKILSNLGVLYSGMANYEKAEPFYLEAKSIREKVLGKEHPEYAASLTNLANSYLYMGQYEKAEPIYLEAKAIYEKMGGREHPDYAGTLSNLGVLYSDMANYEKAELFYLEAKSIREKVLGKENPEYAASLTTLANLYSGMGQYEKAESLFLEAKAIYEKVLGIEHSEYALICLNNLATLYQKMGKYKNAELLFLESKTILEKELGQEHPKYALNLGNLASLYLNLGKYNKAEQLYLEAKGIYEKVVGKEYSQYAVRLGDLANLYRDIGQYDKAEPLYMELSSVNKCLIERAMHHLSEKELNNYVNKLSESQNQTFSFVQKSNSKKAVVASFDNTLFYKGFLLNGANQIKRLALSDSISTGKYNLLKSYGRRLANEYSNPIAERDSSKVAELEEKANLLEKDLARTVTGYGEAMRQVNYQEVQAKLKEGEAAIEFVHYRYYDKKDTDSTMYAALLLQREMSSPVFIPLFEQGALDSILQFQNGRKADYVNSLYTLSDRGAIAIESPKKSLYEILWKPLEKELTGIKTIYFSPSGLLHRINLDAIPISETETLADRFNLIELNSTRQLVIPTQVKNANNDALLFGGIQFEQDSILPNSELPINIGLASRSRGELSFSNVDSTLRGGTWNYLSGTEREVNAIEKTMQLVGVKTNLKKGYEATEESFKNISANNAASPRILHIATHGYFFPDPKSTAKKSSLDGEQESVFKISDHPMLRSGLIMAGGNAAWLGKQTLEGREDGILTAYEISQMNLSNTELVVLSACETGLGDIQGNEGVYGLQRAFKIAGAKYLIMSLWQVPDKQTSLLMTTFYKKWLENKMAIPDAFHAAQKELRDNGLDPYNWAGFVLVE